ncbi:DUF3515 family protein [Micromonospora sp. WMMD980]|uniref:DUF3515 family protein n=1 Tax=Micromonospora sp. WMMD980 TaxID=3016088 RepID=UPI0024180F1E|nr:DUF3515 family protein [Micromonospora sp. WMMD980]MDG4802424.1 DUF3515 family protein [Micromonospora sp. WMMD980]
MEETETTPRRDHGTRRAALWATLVAVPVTVAVAGFTFAKLAPESREATPSASASPRAQSSAPVELPAPALAERPAVLCRALVSQLPDSVRDLRQRPVTAGPEQNAAYGDPALTVACGGTAPQVPPTDEVWTVNKVCWHAVQEADATVLTTVDRETRVRVRVPKTYEQPLQWVTPISDAVVSAVPSAKQVPSGCSG